MLLLLNTAVPVQERVDQHQLDPAALQVYMAQAGRGCSVSHSLKDTSCRLLVGQLNRREIQTLGAFPRPYMG